MHIIGKIFYFLLYSLFFLSLALLAMFLGGVSGTAGTFYVMIRQGDMQQNLTIAIASLTLLWIVILLLSSHNKKVIRRNKLRAQAKMKQEQQND